VKLGEAASNSP